MFVTPLEDYWFFMIRCKRWQGKHLFFLDFYINVFLKISLVFHISNHLTFFNLEYPFINIL